ncbi:baseplate J/gp47 family protein, partial [Escherichia coli]|nr:baseplate J/gp47 family protein [Escherichia coli]
PGMFVATAEKSMLRLHASDVNLTPKPATRASGVIRFIRENTGDDVVIPAGTVVQTERINGVIYSVAVTQETTINHGRNSALVPV